MGIIDGFSVLSETKGFQRWMMAAFTEMKEMQFGWRKGWQYGCYRLGSFVLGVLHKSRACGPSKSSAH